MAEVIYMPPDPRKGIGGSIGQGIGAGLGMYIASYMRQKQQMAFQQKLASTLDPSVPRQESLQMLASIPFQNPMQFHQALAAVNMAKPAKDTTPTEVKGYDPQTGEEISKFVPKGDEPKLNTPQGIEQVFGKPGVSLSKPEVTDFYKVGPDGSYINMGRAPVTQRPEGAFTMQELTLMEKQKADQMAIRRADLADKKFEAFLAKQNDTTDTKVIAKNMAWGKQYKATLQDLIDVKKSIGEDGEIHLDFGGDSKKAQAYLTAMQKTMDYKAKYGGDVNKAAAQALKDAGYYDKPAPPPPAPAAPAEPSLLDRLLGRKPQATPAPATPVAPAANVATPKTPEEFAKIPSGTHYINPKDGKEYIKD